MNCRVYHFSSLSLRKKVWNNGAKTFLLKWGISIKFFKKYYLKSDEKFENILDEPKKNFFFIYLLKCKISVFYHQLLFSLTFQIFYLITIFHNFKKKNFYLYLYFNFI